MKQNNDCLRKGKGVGVKLTREQLQKHMQKFCGLMDMFIIHCSDSFKGVHICQNSSNCTL